MLKITHRKFDSYPIKKEDTLESIATFFGVTISNLVRFHNVYATDKELIGAELPNHLTHIYVQPYLEEKVNSDKTKVTLESGQILHFIPPKKTITYGVMYNIKENEDEDEDEDEIKFETSLTFIKKNQNHFIFEITKNDVYINTEIANLLLDELATQCAQTLYPLQIIVDNTGTYTGIYNHDTIAQRWTETRKKLESYYEGDWFTQYLNETEQTILDQEQLENAIVNDWFIASFFTGIYTNYYLEGEMYEKLAPKTIHFPLLPHCTPIHYEGSIQIEKYLDEYNMAHVEYNGTINDNRSKEDLNNHSNYPYYTLEEGATPAKGELKIKYFLTHKNWIETIYLSCQVENKKVEIIVNEIQSRSKT